MVFNSQPEMEGTVVRERESETETRVTCVAAGEHNKMGCCHETFVTINFICLRAVQKFTYRLFYFICKSQRVRVVAA